MWTFISSVWFLRTRWLWNYTRENPSFVYPGLVLLAVTLTLNLMSVLLGAGSGLRLEPQTLIRNEAAIHIFFMSMFGVWMACGFMTGFRHGTVEWLRSLRTFPGDGPGFMLAHRLTCALDPWMYLLLPVFPLLFVLFGVVESLPGLLIGLVASGCLIHLGVGLVNVAESRINRLSGNHVIRFAAGVLLGVIFLIPALIDMKALLEGYRESFMMALRLTPTGVLLSTLTHLGVGNIRMAFMASLPLMFYAAGIGLIEWRMMRKTLWEGEECAKTSASAGLLQWLDAVVTAALPSRSRRMGPFIARELVSILRFPGLWSMSFFLMLMVATSVDRMGTDTFVSGMIMAGYGVMLCSPVLANRFGMDRMGGVHYLMAPLTARQVMWSKNVAMGILMAVQFLGTAIFLRWRLPSGYPAALFYALLAFNVYLSCIAVSLGGALSIVFPRMVSSRTAFGQTGAAGSSMMAMTATMLVAVIPALALVLLLPGDLWLLAGFLGLAPAGFLMCRWLFRRSVRMFEQRREALFHVFVERENPS